MENRKSMELFSSAPVSQVVLKNALPAIAAMIMVLIYNLADTFFIGQTHDALQVAAVSLATPVFLIFMAVGTVFGIGGTSVISRAMGEGRTEYAKKVCSFCMWGCVIVGVAMSAGMFIFIEPILSLVGASEDTWDLAKTYLAIIESSLSISPKDFTVKNSVGSAVLAIGIPAALGSLLMSVSQIIINS